MSKHVRSSMYSIHSKKQNSTNPMNLLVLINLYLVLNVTDKGEYIRVSVIHGEQNLFLCVYKWVASFVLILTLIILNFKFHVSFFIFHIPHSSTCYAVNLQHSSWKRVFLIRVENIVDPDQLALSEANWSGSTVFSKKIILIAAWQGLRPTHNLSSDKKIMKYS